jgi:hypothetical protein
MNLCFLTQAWSPLALRAYRGEAQNFTVPVILRPIFLCKG